MTPRHRHSLSISAIVTLFAVVAFPQVAGYQYGGLRLGAHTRVTRGGVAPDGGDAALSWENAPLPRGVTLREGIEHPDGGIPIAREGAKGVKTGSATSTGRVVAATLAEAQLYVDGTAPALVPCHSEYGAKRSESDPSFPAYIRKHSLLQQECVARNYNAKQAVASRKQPKLSIVLVACLEDLSYLNQVGCSRKAFYIYLKCSKRRRDVQREIGPIMGCVHMIKEVGATMESDLAWPKHHQQYLEFMIDHYEHLSPTTLFMKANTKQRRLVFSDMVNTAMTSGHEFYSFGHPKVKVDVEQTPLQGDRSLWRREICALYRRYTCIDPCITNSARASTGFDGYFYNTRSMFMVTARRLRTLPRTEYQWLREYIMSIPEREGVKRRYVMERIWQAMLGCPHEIVEKKMSGCSLHMIYPRGQAVKPPEMFLKTGLASWPQPQVEGFIPEATYHLGRAAAHRRLTIVGTYVGRAPRQGKVIQNVLLTAARAYKGKLRIVILTDTETPLETFSPYYFRETLRVFRYPIDLPDDVRRLDDKHPDAEWWQNWIRVRMETAFVRELALQPDVQAELGSLAFIPWDTLQLKSQTAIATKKDSLSLHVCRDSANLKVAIDSGTWYLNIGSLNAAAPLMGASLRLAESTASSMPPPLDGRDTSGGSTSPHPLGQVHLALLRCCVSGRRPARLGGTGGIKMDCNLDYCIRQLSPAHGVVLDTAYQHSDIVPTRNFTAVMAALRQQVADNVRLFGGEADPSSEWTSHVEFLMSQAAGLWAEANGLGWQTGSASIQMAGLLLPPRLQDGLEQRVRHIASAYPTFAPRRPGQLQIRLLPWPYMELDPATARHNTNCSVSRDPPALRYGTGRENVRLMVKDARQMTDFGSNTLSVLQRQLFPKSEL